MPFARLRYANEFISSTYFPQLKLHRNGAAPFGRIIDLGAHRGEEFANKFGGAVGQSLHSLSGQFIRISRISPNNAPSAC